MRIVLATGIYPPDIGGPATYVRALAKELKVLGHQVTVITYGKEDTKTTTVGSDGAWRVVSVPWKGKPVIRWFLFARALKKFAADADIIEAFSSVSVGVPMWLARLRSPVSVLRLGGDFVWERYTDRGGRLGLRQWYERPGQFAGAYWQLALWRMRRLLRIYDHIVFSTTFQQGIFEKHYPELPKHSVIENALPEGDPLRHIAHSPLRLLTLSRLVRFKNLPSLLEALSKLPHVSLTIVGSGPEESTLRSKVAALGLESRVTFSPPVAREQKRRMFDEHDVLVIPSITDISPNAALEARAAGLPVLLTQETGLSAGLTGGMVVRDLSSPDRIADAIQFVAAHYGSIAAQASNAMKKRGWREVAQEHIALFQKLLSSHFLSPSKKESAQRKCVCANSHATSDYSDVADRRPPPVAHAPLGGSQADGTKLLMISGDRSVLAGKKGAFWYTLEELAKHWERIDIICPRSQLTAHSSQPFANVFFHPSPHGLWYHPFWIRRKGSELLKAFCHGSVTIHDYPPFYNGFGARMLLKDFPGVRSVLEIHHVVGYPSPASLNERIGRVLSRAVLPSHVRHFSAVRTVSSSVAGTLVSLGVPQEKIAVVPSFYLDRKSLTPDPSVPKEFDVVCIARLVPNKNIPLLLNALSRLPSATALISGDGPDRPKLERLVRSYGLQLRVHFSGWLKDQAAVVRTLQSGRMVAITSLSEGGPRVALEAMALGLPVIATRVGVLPDVIREGENGFLIPSDPEALALVIERLRSDEALRKHIGTMARSILDRFERGTLVRQYAEFLRQLPHP